MLEQPAADGQVDDRLDAERPQIAGRADPGAQQDRRAAVRAGAEDDRGRRELLGRPSASTIADPDARVAVEEHPIDE